MQWLFGISSKELLHGALMDLDEWGPIYFPSWISRPLKRPHRQWHFFAGNSLKEDWRVTEWGLRTIIHKLKTFSYSNTQFVFLLTSGEEFQCHRFSKEYKVRRIHRGVKFGSIPKSQEPDIEKGGATKDWNGFNSRPTLCVTCLHIPPSQERDRMNG